jgi:hypothetical protein
MSINAPAAVAARPRWATGVADFRAIRAHQIIVACPHCYGTHAHALSMRGSRHVVAGCHTGFSRCREYSIPDVPVSPRPGGRRVTRSSGAARTAEVGPAPEEKAGAGRGGVQQ